jgi:hypothetical protein
MCPNYRPKPETPDGDVRQIALGNGFTAYVDAADYEWLSRWQGSMVGAYAGRGKKGRQKTEFTTKARRTQKRKNGSRRQEERVTGRKPLLQATASK